ncbi:MAG: hypothetical protein JWN10_2435 [Solirubrobacterales bacterium]|nr:hypothetical protein [Solirubrobacterales bacterium]
MRKEAIVVALVARSRRPTAASANLLPLVMAERNAPPPPSAWLEVVVGSIALRGPMDSDVSYVSALVAAVRSAC